MTSPRSESYDNLLAPYLQDDDWAMGYLNEALNDDDPRVALVALRNIIKARGLRMADLAEQSDASRRGLYDALSADGNPGWGTMTRVLKALGLRFSVQPSSKSA